MEDLKKDEYLSKIFSDYFKGAEPKIDISAVTERAKKERERFHKSQIRKNWTIAASVISSAAAVVLMLTVGINAFSYARKNGNTNSAKTPVYSLTDMTAEAVSYTQLKSSYEYIPTGLRHAELASNASVMYTLFSNSKTEIIKTDVYYSGNGFYYEATVYIFPDADASLPEELSEYEDISGTETEYINGEWVSKVNDKKYYGYRYIAEVTSPYKHAVNYLMRLL